MRFRVKAVALDGKEYIDTLEADAVVDLSGRLRGDGYTVTSIESLGPGLLSRAVGAPRAEDLAAMSEQLARLLNAGASLPAALRAVARDVRSQAFQHTLAQTASDVDAGLSLAEALSRRSNHFPPLFRFIVAAGAMSGRLGQALLLVAEYYESTAQLRRRLIESAVYPAVLLAAMLGILFEAAFLVVPQFECLYQQFDMVLPLPTRVAVDIVHHAGTWLPWAPMALLLVLSVLMLCLRARPLRYALDRAALSLPFVGGLLQAFIVAKLSAALALLFESQAPAPQALRIVASMEPNLWVRRAVETLAEQTEQGASLTDAFGGAPPAMIPKTFRWILASSEGAHSLAQGVQRLSDLYGNMAKRRFRNIETLTAPFAILALGALTLLAAGVLLLPLLKSLTVIG